MRSQTDGWASGTDAAAAVLEEIRSDIVVDGSPKSHKSGSDAEKKEFYVRMIIKRECD